MHLSHLDSLFWLSGLIGNILLLVVILRRALMRSFPWFTALIFTSVLKTIALYLMYPRSSQAGYSFAYFYAYWGFAGLDSILQLAVVYEIATQVFRPLGGWARDLHRNLVWLVVISFAVAAGLTWLCLPRTYSWRQALVIRGSLFSSALLAELFGGMTMLSVTAGLPWKTHAARIAQGLGIYSVFCIVVEAGNSYFGLVNGTVASMLLTHTRMLMYLICIVYWIVTLSRREQQSESLPLELRTYLPFLREQTGSTLRTLKGRRTP
jgi:hypothetical protein